MVRPLPASAAWIELDVEDLPSTTEGHVAWSKVFGGERPLRVEVGVGNSPFLIEVCRQSPGFNYLGFEYCRKRVIKFAKRVAREQVENIRILRLDAQTALLSFFPPSSVDHIYVNHPDPWPKRRHAKNRFVQPPVAALLARLLVPGGGVSLRTDAAAYARQMLEVLDACPLLENDAGVGRFSERPVEPFQTPYEMKFRRLGLPIYYLEYRRSSEAGSRLLRR